MGRAPGSTATAAGSGPTVETALRRSLLFASGPASLFPRHVSSFWRSCRRESAVERLRAGWRILLSPGPGEDVRGHHRPSDAGDAASSRGRVLPRRSAMAAFRDAGLRTPLLAPHPEAGRFPP